MRFVGDPPFFTKHYWVFMFQNFKTRFKSNLMYFLRSIFDKFLRFSVFLMLDTLTSITCHL